MPELPDFLLKSLENTPNFIYCYITPLGARGYEF